MTKLFAFLNLKKRPYELLGIMALVLFLVSFVPSNQSVIDINMHDTYFVIANVSLCRVASGALLFLWSVNLVFKKHLASIRLSQLCVVGTLISLGIFFCVVFGYREFPGPPRRYYAFSEFQSMGSRYNAWVITFIIGLLLFTVSQIAFIANIIIGILRKVLRVDPSNQQKAN
ncbi:hypothetical protein [Mucilaginibacter sp. PPCGB 2223]|uniref:hypothetical protein n=1 Tax=Mucilaginibacter sp. PPCGB 2223 TaxID=1886027 RepID=UPI00111267B0|nr:hypothetical protein [Mucilaginibacter sp. PPCGB 2223]